jgi:hypothetical protein
MRPPHMTSSHPAARGRPAHAAAAIVMRHRHPADDVRVCRQVRAGRLPSGGESLQRHRMMTFTQLALG